MSNFLEILKQITEAKDKCPECGNILTSTTCDRCGKYTSVFDTKKKRGGVERVLKSQRPRNKNN